MVLQKFNKLSDSKEWYVYILQIEILAEKHGYFVFLDYLQEFKELQFNKMFKRASNDTLLEYFKSILSDENSPEVVIQIYWELYQRKLCDTEFCKTKIQEYYAAIADIDYKLVLKRSITFV